MSVNKFILHQSSFCFTPRPAVESGMWIPDQSRLQRDCKDDWFAIIDSQEILLYNSLYSYDSCGSMSLVASWCGLILNTQLQLCGTFCSRVLGASPNSRYNLCLPPMNVSQPRLPRPLLRPRPRHVRPTPSPWASPAPSNGSLPCEKLWQLAICSPSAAQSYPRSRSHRNQAAVPVGFPNWLSPSLFAPRLERHQPIYLSHYVPPTDTTTSKFGCDAA